MTHTSGYPQHSGRGAESPLQPPRGHRARSSALQITRRRQARFGASTLAVQSPVFGAAVEISAGGMRLESVSRLVVGGNYVFRLNYGARFLNLAGRVAWCHPQRVEITERGRYTVYQTGVELGPGQPDPRWRGALADRAGVAVGI